MERLTKNRNSSFLVILACAPEPRSGDPVGLPAPGRAEAASWVVLSRAAAQVPPPVPKTVPPSPSKWTISGDLRLVSVAGHLRQRELGAACGRASAQPPQFYGPNLTCEYGAPVRSGVRAGEPCRVGV